MATSTTTLNTATSDTTSSSQWMKIALPYAIAMEVLLEGKRLTAEQALQFGLVNEVVEPEKVINCAFKRAEALTKLAPLAQRAIKELAVRSQSMPLDIGFRMEEAMIARLFESEDFKEGSSAFAQKRVPEFNGR